ncbi:hypothetical protein [Paenarthrobacter ureafaciens]|uniref:hypothetical protein n=1 Tax=Paenarthrobacter ureafaciens TaxID=37931 RepID=UPI0021F19EAD|nr:hypothetical protein [Paenarthrobacter ureafaciens]MEC3853938.1 hypothetical protein [Paenarthrobacter ureafaciens]
MGLRNLFAKHRTPEPAAPSPAPPRIESVERVPLTAEQQADLSAAPAEFLQAVGEAGVNQLHACGRGGSRWQDDPQALRAISSILRDLHLEEKNH